METRTDPLASFNGRFCALTGHRPLEWQKRLFCDYFLRERIPAALDLPTGLGKTSVMAIWYLARKMGAPVPRRLVYVVDRRAVVDQATEEAETIRNWADDDGLRISTLRGQLADNAASRRREWLEDPAATAIVVGTVDMIGSRLLFEGYGVNRRMRPYHAGLLGVDTLVVLDESHLVPPFERLLEQIAERGEFGAKGEGERRWIPRFRLLPLSATGRDRDGDVFRLTEEDRKDPVVERRLAAEKRLTFAPTGDDKLERRLAEAAWERSDKGESPARVLVYCNRRDVAEKTKAEIEKAARGARVAIDSELFVGARRVRERETAKTTLKRLGFFSGDDAPARPAFVIATSAGEVGVDLDADHMVMDLVPFERMVQRLGRVNRLGDKDAKVVAVHEGEPKPKKPEAPTDEERRAIIAWRALEALKELPRHQDCSHDASPDALVHLKGAHKRTVDAASSPEPLYPALTRPLVDAWSMTSLGEHTGRPEVQPWLRGWVDDPPQTTLVWRKYLPVRVEGGTASEREVADFFAAAPPQLTEKLETGTSRVCDWLLARAKKLVRAIEKAKLEADADGAGKADAAEPPPLDQQEVVAIALDRSGEDARCSTLDRLLKAAESKRDKEALTRDITNRTLIVDARMGGLCDDGLLDPQEERTAPTPDTEGAWESAIGFRVRSVVPDAESADAHWHKPYLFDLRCDGEGNPLRQLRVEKYRNAPATREEERSLSPRRAQRLEEHQEWTARKARELVTALGLAGDIADAIVLAARLHDEGKKAAIWQRAFSADTDGIYAKTRGPFLPNALGHYRHEFGSLPHVERSNRFGTLPEDLRDLVLHLVAAHHGRARPVIGTDGCEQPPSALEARAREVALRFARLQRRFGPWGLAWLEALLRAADQQASRDLDEGRTLDG